MNRRQLTGIFIALVMASTFAAGAAAQENWRWSVTPYIWASDLSEDLTLRGQSLGSSDTTFRDLVDITDASYTVHIQGIKGELGFYLDGSSADLSDEDVTDNMRTDVSITEKIFSGGLIFHPGGDGGSFDLLLGARYLSADERYVITVGPLNPITLANDDSYVDLMVGARYKWLLGDRWAVGVVGDASSGGTEYIWTGEGLVGWRFGSRRQSSILAGYRHRELQYRKSDDRILVERTFSGPVFAIQFGF